MARLSKEQWQEARKRWESDSRDGFAWLADELGVSRPAVSKMASSNGWKKRDVTQVTVSDKVTQKLRSKVTKSNADKDSIKREVVPNKTAKSTVPLSIEKRGPGAETLYKPEYNDLAYKFCLLGATDEEMADFFGVTEQTINNWKKNHDGFFESIREGKMAADAGIAQSLYKRALGYTYTEERTKEAVIRDGEGEAISDELQVVEVTKTVKEVAPDTGAAFIWLKNRRSKDWKDKQEVTFNHTIDKEMMDRLTTTMMELQERSRERQKQVLIERGLIIDAVNVDDK
jgi:transcriptional regulator with XRE-family HTH domain